MTFTTPTCKRCGRKHFNFVSCQEATQERAVIRPIYRHDLDRAHASQTYDSYGGGTFSRSKPRLARGGS